MRFRNLWKLGIFNGLDAFYSVSILLRTDVLYDVDCTRRMIADLLLGEARLREICSADR